MRRWWRIHQPISFGPKSRTLLRGSVVAALLTLTALASAAPAAAEGNQAAQLQFSVSEMTHFVACPAGTPAGSACAEGQGTGYSDTLGAVSESFVSTIDLAHPDPRLGILMVSSRVTLTMATGDTLVLVAHGRYNPRTGTDSEVFRVVSGTGAYRDAEGAGTAQSTTTGQAGTSVLTTTVYDGVLITRDAHDDRVDHAPRPAHEGDD